MKAINFILYITLGLLLFTGCNSQKPVLSRINLQMPKFVDLKKFKNQIPIAELNSFRSYAKAEKRLTPLLNYHFTIDQDGNIRDGKFDNPHADRSSFFITYIENVFNTYKWHPAFYTGNKQHKLRSMVKMSIYDNSDKNVFEITFRLSHLPDKERVQDILDERNLIYRFKIR